MVNTVFVSIYPHSSINFILTITFVTVVFVIISYLISLCKKCFYFCEKFWIPWNMFVIWKPLTRRKKRQQSTRLIVGILIYESFTSYLSSFSFYLLCLTTIQFKTLTIHIHFLFSVTKVSITDNLLHTQLFWYFYFVFLFLLQYVNSENALFLFLRVLSNPEQ